MPVRQPDVSDYLQRFPVVLREAFFKEWRVRIMKKKKGFRSAWLAVAMAAMLAGSFSAQEVSTEQPSGNDQQIVRVGAMSGPTAMGMVRLMELSSLSQTQNTYEFADLMTDASAFAAPLSTGELDIAAVPANLAAALWNKTEGKIQVLAINVSSVLHIVERGDEIHSLEDLKGKKLYATGQGATPEAVLTYLLAQKGIALDTDLEIQWCADTTEALSYVTEDEGAIAMLPQPFVTAACAKVEGLHPALDLGEEWEKLENGSAIVTGVLAVRSDFAAEHPETVQTFLEEYAVSAAYPQEEPEKTAQLIEDYGIVASAALAQKALPSCGITFVTGDEMQETLSGYLSALGEINPALVGGKLPEEAFYYKG